MFIFVRTRNADLAAAGIGVHHAGIHHTDRQVVEDLYLKKIIRVVVATSVKMTCHARYWHG